MSNVKMGEGGGSSSVPEIYKGEGHPGECKYPPDTIHSQLAHASGKAKMNFSHRPLGPEQHYIDGEEADGAISRSENEGTDAGDAAHEHSQHEHHLKGGGGGKSHKPMHRSTSGAPGHGITGT